MWEERTDRKVEGSDVANFVCFGRRAGQDAAKVAGLPIPNDSRRNSRICLEVSEQSSNEKELQIRERIVGPFQTERKQGRSNK